MLWAKLLAAVLLLTIAVAGTATAQPGRFPVRPPAEPPVERPTIPGPRFIVTAIEFEALDETWIDSLGSDQVVSLFGGRNYTVVTREFDDVDSDDGAWAYEEFENCIFPPVDPDGERNNHWACSPRGGSAPLHFAIALFEQDSRLPGEFCIRLNPIDILPVNASTCEAGGRNDLIGSAELQYSLEQLLTWLPRPGSRLRGHVTLQCGNGFCAGGPVYQVTYQIRRVRDAR